MSGVQEERGCKVCNKVLKPNKRFVYCSLTCRYKNMLQEKKAVLEQREPKKCRECSQEIQRSRQAVYCSWACRYKWEEGKRREALVGLKPLCKCGQCNKEFKSRLWKGQLFCSMSCKREFLEELKAQELREKDCLGCEEKFRPTVRKQMYCSAECRQRAWQTAYGLGITLKEYSEQMKEKIREQTPGFPEGEAETRLPGAVEPSVPAQAPEPVVLEPSHQTVPLEKKELDLAEIQRLAVRSAFLGEE